MAFSERTSQILTFLYTDIEGSTRLWEQYPDSMETTLSSHDRIMHEAVGNHGGIVFRSTGDGFCAAFSNASSALAAALQAQLALQAEAWGDTGPLQVRMAIHTGEVEARGGDYSGNSLNRIGRLLGLAHGGQTLVSHAAQLLVRDTLPAGAGLLNLGEIRLRDLSNAEPIFQLAHPNLPVDFPPLASVDRRPNNLPTQPSALVGRQAELAEIQERLSSEAVRLLTLTGPGGLGKTRLGLQAAADLIDRFEHGVFFIDLASIREPESVLPAIARTLGIRESSYRPILEDLKDGLRDREMLLLLDNFEQVTAAAPRVVELLAGCPKIKILVTSREALRVRGERIFPVSPLNLPAAGRKQLSSEELIQFEAIRLFVERAQAVKPSFVLTEENATDVVEICRRLDGLPLAIELAASRLKLFSTRALLERLESRLSVLRGGARDLPERQKTLRDTIAWSYDLLDPAGQYLFELLSVFPGGGTFESFEMVAGMVERLEELDVDPIDGLTSLVDKSLVRQVGEVNGEPRLVMLQTIREFARERLEMNPEFSAAARRAHAAYFADFIQIQGGRLNGENAPAALVAMEVEIENLHAAWRYWIGQADLEQLSKFFNCLQVLYDARGWYHALVDLTTDLLEVLSASPSSPERARQEIVLQTSLASALLITRGYVSIEVERAYQRARQLIEEVGETPQLMPVLAGLSRYYSYRNEAEQAIQIGEQILELAEQLDDADIRVMGHLVLGTNYSFFIDLSLGQSHLEQGIALYAPEKQRTSRWRQGSDPGIACLITSALNLWMLGFPEKALSRAIETVDLAKRLNHPFSKAYSLFHTGLLHLWTQQIGQAEEYAEVLMGVAEEYEFDLWKAVGSCLLGAVQVGMGRVEQGFKHLRWGMETYQGLKTPPIFWTLLIFNQAEACLRAGEPAKGLALLVEAMQIEGENEQGALAAEFCRLRGDLLCAISAENAAEAESWFERALQIARAQKARMLALRAAVRLARLWRGQGNTTRGRQLLGEVYQEMTEGFALVDMQEARAILEDVP